MITQTGTTIPTTQSGTHENNGIWHGTSCAQQILRNTQDDPHQASASRAIIIAKAHEQIASYISDNGLTSDLEWRFRVGFARGLASQLLHPDAVIETLLVKP